MRSASIRASTTAHWDARVAPAFGENITSAGVAEEDTLIGDVWRIGTALVQVAQPRSPCFKVAARLAIPDLVMRARRTRFTGLHLRVLEPGELAAGDAIELVERAAHGITVADAVAARFDPAPDQALVAAVLGLPELAEQWREKTAPRLSRAPRSASGDASGGQQRHRGGGSNGIALTCCALIAHCETKAQHVGAQAIQALTQSRS